MLKGQDQIILVDFNDQFIGFMEKLQAHKMGKLHRAVSVFIFNNKGHLLIQQRALKKYHSALLWGNTACSHPCKGENIEITVHRCLKEEMGFDCILHKKFCFTYKGIFNNGFTEHEFDHVFIGNYNDTPEPNDHEVADWKWIDINELQKAIRKFPNNYTIWLKIILEKYIKNLFL